MSTIERLAELARSASKGLWHYGAYAVEDDDGRIICNMSGWKNEAQTRRNGEYIAACNPAAIQQATAEFAAMRERAEAAEQRNVRLVEALDVIASGHSWPYAIAAQTLAYEQGEALAQSQEVEND